MEQSKIQNFTDLIAWQKSHALVLEIYKATESFPKQESFGLTSQLRRASVSITSNVAEGFGRKSKLEKNRYHTIAIGSLLEVYNQLMIARDLSYISIEKFSSLEGACLECKKLIRSLFHY